MNRMTWAALLLLLTGSNAWALDLCFYIDADGAVLRTEATTAEITLGNDGVVHCTIAPPISPAMVKSGTCQDQPELVFPVFAAASDPALGEDDLLIFRNEVWYRKCAFNR